MGNNAGKISLVVERDHFVIRQHRDRFTAASSVSAPFAGTVPQLLYSGSSFVEDRTTAATGPVSRYFIANTLMWHFNVFGHHVLMGTPAKSQSSCRSVLHCSIL